MGKTQQKVKPILNGHSKPAKVALSDFLGTNTKFTGTVKSFGYLKGWGFIVVDEFGDEIFIHYSDIKGQKRRRSLSQGQHVEFTIAKGKKRGQIIARNCKVIV